MNLLFKRKLPIPYDIKHDYPLDKSDALERNERLKEIKDVFLGLSNKFILIIGPCSADNLDSVKEYMNNIARVSKEVSDKIIIIPRLYTNKPRSSGEGYMGLLHQPNPSKEPDLLNGLISQRLLHMDVLHITKLVCADELLYPENYRYISDLVGYVAIGARSVSNQQHRLVASGLDIPVGMKNPESGDLDVMMNAIHASNSKHTFIYRGWEVESKGNMFAHAILRGYKDLEKNVHSNYHYDDLLKVYQLFDEYHIANKSVIVDCNHLNSNKDYLKQIDIAFDVLSSRKKDPNILKMVKGLMIESYLEDGSCAISDSVFGKSITDPCLGIEKTIKLIKDIYNSL